MKTLIEFLMEAVSRGNTNKYPKRPDANSGISDITEWLEYLGFEKVERIPGGKSSSLKIPKYSLNKGDHRFTIEFKFIGKNRRWYWGQFTKGVYDLYTKLVDITNPASPSIMFDSGSMSSRNPADIINDVTEFVEDDICHKDQ